jgi:hypothetical protein|tara:strand:- start:1415 stop:1645 length:231 start_codon:yes stop_codon:yes gene_type:complete
MIWVLTVMMWYEGEQTRNTHLQDMQFISEDHCQDYLFDNKVMLVDSLLLKFRDIDGMTMQSFEYFCEGRFVEMDEV